MPKVVDDELKIKAMTLLKKGKKLTIVAKAVGVTVATIRNWKQKYRFEGGLLMTDTPVEAKLKRKNKKETKIKEKIKNGTYVPEVLELSEEKLNIIRKRKEDEENRLKKIQDAKHEVIKNGRTISDAVKMTGAPMYGVKKFAQIEKWVEQRNVYIAQYYESKRPEVEATKEAIFNIIQKDTASIAAIDLEDTNDENFLHNKRLVSLLQSRSFILENLSKVLNRISGEDAVTRLEIAAIKDYNAQEKIFAEKMLDVIKAEVIDENTTGPVVEKVNIIKGDLID